MVYMRGSRHDYDEWERRGATGWGYDDVLPYFLRSEQMLSSTLTKSSMSYTLFSQTICSCVLLTKSWMTVPYE